MRAPPPRPFMTLQERGQNSLLGCSIDQPCDIGWCGGSGGGRVYGVGRQDGGVAPTEDFGLKAGKIFLISSRQLYEARVDGQGCHGGWERLAGRK